MSLSVQARAENIRVGIVVYAYYFVTDTSFFNWLEKE